MTVRTLGGLGGLAVGVVAAVWLLAGGLPGEREVQLLNVSYDPTRELFGDLNAAFARQYAEKTGTKLTIKQSHGGSSSQARSVIDGLDGDVVTLAWWPDVDAIRRKGLIEDNWETRLPHRSLPYYSTIVFVVRKGNPKGIEDWADLGRDDVQIVTPNPKTSGNGKLSFLAAWGAVIARGGSEAEARDYVTQLYRHVPILDTGARTTVTFSQKKIGDVHLTWENEAYLEIAEAKGELELVYPSVSIRAEPPVAVVDAVVRRKGTAEHARAYLEFLYTDEAQEIIARHHYRPRAESVRGKNPLPELKLFAIDRIARDWDDAQQKFFAEGGVFDQVSH